METKVKFVACDMPEATPFMLHVRRSCRTGSARNPRSHEGCSPSCEAERREARPSRCRGSCSKVQASVRSLAFWKRVRLASSRELSITRRVWSVARLIRREEEETAAVFVEASASIAEFDALPSNFAETWFRNEAAINPEFREAWDARHGTSEGARWARQQIDRAVSRLQDAARAEHQRIEGRALTEDRAALTAWMTRTTGRHPRVHRRAMAPWPTPT